jgi:hypothetical protein
MMKILPFVFWKQALFLQSRITPASVPYNPTLFALLIQISLATYHEFILNYITAHLKGQQYGYECKQNVI